MYESHFSLLQKKFISVFHKIRVIQPSSFLLFKHYYKLYSLLQQIKCLELIKFHSTILNQMCYQYLEASLVFCIYSTSTSVATK